MSESNHIVASMVRQQAFLTELLARLDSDSTAADVSQCRTCVV